LFGGKRHGSYDPAVAGRTMAELWLRGVVADVASIETNGLHSNGKNGKRDAKTSRHRNSS
jgi:hypothetical protein